MRSLCITMRTQGSILLPLAYNELIQGILYSCWRDDMGFVHDAELADTHPFRPFVFSRLEGRSTANGKARTIQFNGLVSFEVRSMAEELVGACAEQLYQRQTIRLGAYDLDLVNLETRDRLLFPQRSRIRLRTPVVAHSKREGGGTDYFSPTDADWLAIVQQNALRKAEGLGISADGGLQVLAYTETLRKQVTRFKGTYVTGYLGDLLVSGDSSLIATLWCCGLGTKNSQGFGMFDILDSYRV